MTLWPKTGLAVLQDIGPSVSSIAGYRPVKTSLNFRSTNVVVSCVNRWGQIKKVMASRFNVFNS